MQAIILAAGEGRRLRPLTLEKPKPLVEVNGKSLLEYNMDNLEGLVDEIILIIGYKGEQIREKFGDNYKGIKLIYVEQKEQLGTGHALLMAERFVKDRFLVVSGDDLYSRRDIENCLRYELCVLAKRVDNPERFGIIFLKDDKVYDITEKPKDFIGNLANIGVYTLNKAIFDELKKLKKNEKGEYLLVDGIKELAQKLDVKCIEVEGYWIPVAYPEDLEKASKILRNFHS